MRKQSIFNKRKQKRKNLKLSEQGDGGRSGKAQGGERI